MHCLTQGAAAALSQFAADGDWTHLLTESDELRVLDRPLLPGMPVAVARQGDLLWVLIDMGQDGSLEQLRELIESWPMAALWQSFDRTLDTELGSLVG